MLFELRTRGVNDIILVHVFKSCACSSNWAATLESLVWHSICFESYVMLVICGSRTTELLLTMAHLDEINSQWTCGLVKITSSCHDCPVTIRVRHSDSCSSRVRFLIIVHADVIF